LTTRILHPRLETFTTEQTSQSGLGTTTYLQHVLKVN
jgi:hypothetical protein